MKARILTSAATIAFVESAPLAAQATVGPESDTTPAAKAMQTTHYDAAFFVAFAPRSALDIARRVPGFALELGNSDIRGFAGAAGNVVFNGARPSSKAESLIGVIIVNKLGRVGPATSAAIIMQKSE